MRVLITGANSYIGTSFERYIKDYYSGEYEVDTLDMLDPNWINYDFSTYDSVFHVAGIAHSDNGKISKEKEKLYRSVNTDLTVETARKAKSAGVKQFIFMSSAIVYGESAPIGKKKHITKETEPSPSNCYGDSKLQAEIALKKLSSSTFKICVLRPPMIYGKGSKGNFPTLEKFAKKLMFFPYVNNARSMLYIGNLVEFVRLMIENNEEGIFFPQNKEYSNTSELVKMIANSKNKKLFLVKGFGWCLKLLGLFTGLINKAFGNLIYDNSLSVYKENYNLYSLEESINDINK